MKGGDCVRDLVGWRFDSRTKLLQPTHHDFLGALAKITQRQNAPLHVCAACTARTQERPVDLLPNDILWRMVANSKQQ